MYPNIDLRAHLTIWGAVFAGCLAVILTLAAPVWVWLPVGIWLVLWGCAILALHADPYWPARLVTILRDPDFKQVYQWVTVPLLARVWRRLCDHNPASSSAAATFGAALTARLYDRALLIALAYPILLPVLVWLSSGQAGQIGEIELLSGAPTAPLWPDRFFALAALLMMPGFAILRSSNAGTVRSLPLWLWSLLLGSILAGALLSTFSPISTIAAISLFVVAFAFGVMKLASKKGIPSDAISYSSAIVLGVIAAAGAAASPVAAVLCRFSCLSSSSRSQYSILCYLFGRRDIEV